MLDLFVFNRDDGFSLSFNNQAEEYGVQMYKGQSVEWYASGTILPFLILDLI